MDLDRGSDTRIGLEWEPLPGFLRASTRESIQKFKRKIYIVAQSCVHIGVIEIEISFERTGRRGKGH